MGQQVRVGAASEVFDDFMQPSRYKAIYGGRGSAKSHFFAECMVANAAANKNFRAVCIREVQKSLKESAKRLLEDKINILGLADRFDILNDSIKTPGNGIVIFQGMQDHTAESIKSLEGFNVAWVEEAQTLSAKSLELLRPTIRAPGSEIWFSWNPTNENDPVDQFFRGLTPPDNAIIRKINYDQNRFFPNELEEERSHDYEHAPDRYSHIWEGEYEPMAVGAIWDRANIHAHRRTEAPEMGRILVSIDPAISAEAGSDEHGIIVAGLGMEGRGYVLDDCSRRGTPKEWATSAIAAYDEWDADAIVIERNQGGDMCRHTLETVRPGIRIIEVVATRGKHVRAEPISSLYSQGRISHVGTFPELEAQMVRMTSAGYEGDGSPDRVDALVWNFTELFPKMVKRPRPKIDYRNQEIGSWMG